MKRRTLVTVTAGAALAALLILVWRWRETRIPYDPALQAALSGITNDYRRAGGAEVQGCCRLETPRSGSAQQPRIHLLRDGTQRRGAHLPGEDALPRSRRKEAQGNIAELYLKQGRREEAKKHYEAYLTLYPASPKAEELRRILQSLN